MSFVYGGVSTDDLPGVSADLSAWPSLGGQGLQTVDVPGGGRFFGGSSRTRSRFTFEVRITGASPQQVYQRRDDLVAVLDPARGPRDLRVEGETDWVIPDVMVAEEISWERVVWRSGLALILSGDVVFETTRVASAREATPQEVAVSTSGTVAMTGGNTVAYPTVRWTTHALHGDYTFTLAGVSVTIDRFNSWDDTMELVLDWDRMRFHLEDNTTGERLASAVGSMSTFDRPELYPGESASLSIDPDRTVTVTPNARRI